MTREKTIEWLIRIKERYIHGGDEGYDALRKEAIDTAIKALEQEPKTGHWEWLTEDKYRCSNCNHETRVDECMNKPMYDFCPFCCADMREE